MQDGGWPEEARARIAQLEQALADERARWSDAEQHRLAFARHPLPMFLLDADTLAILDANDAACVHYGWSHEEFCRLNARDIRPPEDLVHYQRVVDGLREGQILGSTLRHKKRDGTIIVVEVRTQFLTVGSRRARLSVVTDVTHQQQAEAALARTLKRLQLIFDSTSELMALFAREAQGTLRCEAVNRPLQQLWGRSIEQLVGHPLEQLLDESDWRMFERACRESIEQGASTRTHAMRFTADARLFDVRIHPVLDPAGRCTHLLCTAREMTEEHQLRERLQLADRMASLGTLAAGVAHEVNNPLAFALTNLTYLEGELERSQQTGRAPFAEALQALADAKDGLERVRQIVRDLKMFCRPAEEPLQPVEVWPVLEASLQLVQNEIRHRARLVRETGDVPPVQANAARLGQLFVNLLANAAHAIGEGDAAHHAIRLSTRQRPDGMVEIAVADSGSGIAPHVLPRIFEPFFTTKPVGEGTGLGLSVCDGIVRSLGGRIEVESTEGAGTTFRVLLPPAERRAAPPRQETTPPPPRRRKGRLLVIDDEPTAEKAFERLLGEEHEVVVLSGAAQALARLEAGERFDAILCDLMMPQMSGMDFHAHLRAHHPDVEPRVLFVTGGAFTDKARHFAEQMGPRCLEKPFDLALLRKSLQRLVG